MVSLNKKKIIIISILIISFSIFLKVYDLTNPISTNGIDEGVHLLQAKMVNEGYNYYEDLNGDQAPLAVLIFSFFKGDVMSCRYLCVFLFLISSAAVFFIAEKRGGTTMATLALVILSLDFTIHRESRLASLDIFSASLLCISSLFFMRYFENTRIIDLSLGSFFLSSSLLAKILPVFFALFISFFIVWRSWRTQKALHSVVYLIFLFIPFVIVLYFFSFTQLLEGIVLSQMHRGINWYSKLSFFLFIGPSFIYLFALRKWDVKDEKNLYLILWALLLLIPIMVQGRTFQHHFAFAAYPLSILTAGVIIDGKKVKKIALSGFVIGNICLLSFLCVSSPLDRSYDVAKEIENITQPDDMLISGNPIINVISHRFAPPNLTNLAAYHYPPVQDNDVIYWLEKNGTTSIVLYYHLGDMEGVTDFLEKSTQWNMYKEISGKGQLLFDGYIPKFSEDVYRIYVKQ